MLIKTKKIKTIIICVLVLSLLSFCIVWQYAFSYSVCGVTVTEREYEQLELDQQILLFSEDNTFFYGDLKNGDPFPSQDVNDYSNYYVSFKFRNAGVFNYYLTDAYIEYLGDDRQIVSYDENMFLTVETMRSFSEDTIGVYLLSVFRKDMTNEDVVECLKDYQITVYAENFYNKKMKMVVKLSDYDISIQPLK